MVAVWILFGTWLTVGSSVFAHMQALVHAPVMGVAEAAAAPEHNAAITVDPWDVGASDVDGEDGVVQPQQLHYADIVADLDERLFGWFDKRVGMFGDYVYVGVDFVIMAPFKGLEFLGRKVYEKIAPGVKKICDSACMKRCRRHTRAVLPVSWVFEPEYQGPTVMVSTMDDYNFVMPSDIIDGEFMGYPKSVRFASIVRALKQQRGVEVTAQMLHVLCTLRKIQLEQEDELLDAEALIENNKEEIDEVFKQMNNKELAGIQVACGSLGITNPMVLDMLSRVVVNELLERAALPILSL